ncbi:amidohydrolase family protein [Spiroplasma cantharicola]|uniref:Dihydroorotase n=1 Tax=Spiroplasma cantharicola TaxID=362837 RepID=A0A0M4KEP7_9MOLU|nr:amidohydrolase family protein [Spiroplasma cantharicola]ALD66507.1 dihydroorotase [Spiroplasma cantharicola]
MLKILNIKDINNNLINIYIWKSLIYLKKPKNIKEDDFKQIEFEKDIYVSYGWIDSHVHCDNQNKLYGSILDEIGYKNGVTTVIDAGSVGINSIERMWNINKQYITNLKILLNISKKGIYKQSELSNLKDIQFDYDKKFDNFVVGYKARMSNSVTLQTGLEPLKIFADTRKEKKIRKPIMVHIGNEPPKFLDIIKLLKKGDIITHIYNYKNNSLFNKDFTKTQDLEKAIDKKILFDVGHGNESFIFECAKESYRNNFIPDIISTDIYETNIKNKKVKSLSVTMNKFRKLGMEWKDILDRVIKNPYNFFNLRKMGEIKNGYIANLTFFKIKKNKNIEIDSKENILELEEQIVPLAVIVNGKFYEVQNNDEKI